MFLILLLPFWVLSASTPPVERQVIVRTRVNEFDLRCYGTEGRMRGSWAATARGPAGHHVHRFSSRGGSGTCQEPGNVYMYRSFSTPKIANQAGVSFSACLQPDGGHESPVHELQTCIVPPETWKRPMCRRQDDRQTRNVNRNRKPPKENKKEQQQCGETRNTQKVQNQSARSCSTKCMRSTVVGRYMERSY